MHPESLDRVPPPRPPGGPGLRCVAGAALAIVVVFVAGLVIVSPGPARAEGGPSAPADAAFSAQRDANRAAKSAQQKVEDLDDEAQALLARYRSIVTETASYDAYSAQLERSIASQDAEIADIQSQMARAGDTARDVLPLTNRLIDDLETFVSLDAPFHVEERRERIAGLRALMGRADVSLSEKYRRVIEAYLIELEFGRTMETFPGVLESTGDPLTVDYLRIGRIALLYQTPDGGRTGYWDGDAKRWVEIAKNAGMKYIVITSKHHDGFCLWPSAHTTHSVASSHATPATACPRGSAGRSAAPAWT